MGREDPVGDVLVALGREPFFVGLVLGVACLAILVVALRRGRGALDLVRSHAGLLVAVAAVVGLTGVARSWLLLAVGVVGLGAAGLGHHVAAPRRTVVAVGALGVAALAIDVGLMRGAVSAAVVAVLAVVGVRLFVAFDRDAGVRSHGALLLLLAAGGLFGVLPDTPPALVLLGVFLPMVAALYLVIPAIGAGAWGALGPAGAAACGGLVAWTVGAGAAGQGRALVGGAACLGLLALEPLARWPPLRGVSPFSGRQVGVGTAVAIGLQVIIVFVASRVGGMRATASEAAVIVLPVYTVAALALLFVARARSNAASELS